MNSTFRVSRRTPGHNPPPPRVSSATVTLSVPKSRLHSLALPHLSQPPSNRVEELAQKRPDMVETLNLFRESLQHAVAIGDAIGDAIVKRNQSKMEEYEKRKMKEFAIIERKQREIAEAEAVIRLRREKIRVKKAELQAVRETAVREEEQTVAHMNKRAARMKVASQEIVEHRIYVAVYGKLLLAIAGIDYTSAPGKCICPEGKIVSSVNPAEETCNFWDCPSLAKYKVPPSKPSSSSSHHNKPPRPHLPRIPSSSTPTSSRNVPQTLPDAETEPTGELFEPTKELFPERTKELFPERNNTIDITASSLHTPE